MKAIRPLLHQARNPRDGREPRHRTMVARPGRGARLGAGQRGRAATAGVAIHSERACLPAPGDADRHRNGAPPGGGQAPHVSPREFRLPPPGPAHPRPGGWVSPSRSAGRPSRPCGRAGSRVARPAASEAAAHYEVEIGYWAAAGGAVEPGTPAGRNAAISGGSSSSASTTSETLAAYSA